MANYNSLYTGAQIDSAIGALNTAVQPADLAVYETSTELNARDSANRARANHTGTQTASTISDFTSSVNAIVSGLGLSTLDSADITTIVDSAYVQARQDFAYSSLTGVPSALDSATILQLIDSDYIQAREANNIDIFGLVDSAYVQERQDFAYSSLTGTPNILDSALTTQLIDSDYIQARQLSVAASGLDSAEIIQLVDSDYIEARRPAEVIFDVVNNDAVAYVFEGDGFPSPSDNNPALYLQKGMTYKFSMNASGHPFQIRVSDGGAAYNTGVTNNGADVGDVIFTVPMDAPDTLYYQCTVHSGMGAVIYTSEISGITTDNLSEGSTNLYYTSARVDSDIQALVDSAYVQLRQDFAYSSLTGTPTVLDSALVTQLIDSDYIQLRQSSVGTGGLDSALVTQLIDSAYVQLRQDFAYSSLTGTPTLLDSALIAQLIDSDYVQLRQSSVGTGGLDSALVTQLIDSAYVQLRETPQDFAYASLTGAPNVLDSADVAAIAGSISGLDSTGVRSLVDSAYVQARQDYAYSSLTGAPTALSAFTNDTLYLDSVTATQLIDSAYIQARQSNVGTGGVDSAYVTSQINALIDGAPGALDTLNELAAAINDDSQAYNTLLSLVNAKIDSAVALTLITTTVDSAYVQLRQDFAYASLTGAPNVLDSADVSAIAGSISGLDSTGVRTLLADSSFTIDGDGTNGGVIISDGSVEIKTSTGSPAFADFYCEVGNIHRTRVKSAPHAQYSGNVDVTLPVTTGTLALTSDITLDSAAVISLIDSAYVQLRQSSVGSGGLDSALVTQLIDSAYVALRAPAASGGIDSAAANSLIDAKIEIIDIADIIGATGNTGEYLKSLGNGNAEWATFESVIDSAYIQLRQSSVGSGGLDSALVTQLIDSAYIQLRQTDLTGLDSALTIQLIDSAYVQLRQDFAYSSLTGAPNVLDSADVSAIAGGLSGLDSNGVIALVDSAYVQLRQDFAYASLTGAPTALSSFTNDTLYLDSATATQLIDSAYVALRAPAAAGGIDSAAANTLIDAKVQVLNIADIVGANGNPGEYLKSLGSGNATWENVTTVIDSAYVAARAPAAAIDSAGVISLVDSAYVAARVTGTLSAWQKKSENYTLAVGDRIAVNTDSAWTLTLPASPSFSDEVYIIDATGNAALKNITVSGNSQKILASDSDLIINVNRASVAMMFYGDSQGWILTSAF